MASNVARFLRKQYLDSLGKEDNSNSSDPTLVKFKAIEKKLRENGSALTNPESISLLSDLNEAVAEWRIHKEQNKSIKRIFPCAQMNERAATGALNLESLLEKLSSPEELKGASSSSTELSQPNLLPLDRYTFYKPDQKTFVHDDVSDAYEKRMVDWLLGSGDDLKPVGIYGIGGSGKTALVRNVLKQETVGGKFKRIIWVCLSQLTSEEEIDVRIIEHLVYRLGLDTDSQVRDDEDDTKKEEWLMEEVERRLLKPGSYVLVLDDMWFCSKWFTDKFLGELKRNSGGAVVVTSRKKTVVERICEKNRLMIQVEPGAYKESAFWKPG